MAAKIKCSEQILSRLRAVKERHKALDRKIASEHQSPQPNSLILQNLKRRRLWLKDELKKYNAMLRRPAGRTA